MDQSHSIWVKLERYPPVIVRLLARSGTERGLLTDEAIQRRTCGQLSLADIKQLSYTPSWDGIAVEKMRLFCIACGVDFADRARMRTLNRYLRDDPKFQHLRRDPNFNEYQTMLNEYLTYESNRG